MCLDRYKKLYKIVDQILFEEWDPISVNNDIELRDEYRDYVPSIVSLIMKGEGALKISSRLVEITVDSMGYCLIPSDSYLKVAKKIIKKSTLI